MSTKDVILELIARGFKQFAEIVNNGATLEYRFTDGKEVIAVLVDSNGNCELEA